MRRVGEEVCNIGNIQSRQQKKVRRSDWFRYKVANKMRDDIDTMG
jgi:hypothetical protein